ncbi:MAG: hypothetical protein IK102_07055 [Treponema sp.]|nr:hypothetical protein [Treponema sp.]
MKNIKFVAICAASGFILSLVCGFFSHSGFGRIFLIALLFAVIFGGLAFGISLIFDKFLDTDKGADISVSASDDGIVPSDTRKTVGQHVDLVIQEEELEQSGNQNHYDVGENHQMLNDSDYKGQNSVSSEGTDEKQIQEKNEFVPIRNLETINNFSGNESMTSQESDQRREIIAEQNQKKGDEIDVLPDMSDFQVASDGSSPDSETVVLSDSDEAEFVHSATNYKSSDASAGDIKDASLMAKAISSILSEEDS